MQESFSHAEFGANEAKRLGWRALMPSLFWPFSRKSSALPSLIAAQFEMNSPWSEPSKTETRDLRCIARHNYYHNRTSNSQRGIASALSNSLGLYS